MDRDNVFYDFDDELYIVDIQKTVVHLKFGNSFNQPVDNVLPSSIRTLIFGHSFNQPVNMLLVCN